MLPTKPGPPSRHSLPSPTKTSENLRSRCRTRAITINPISCRKTRCPKMLKPLLPLLNWPTQQRPTEIQLRHSQTRIHNCAKRLLQPTPNLLTPWNSSETSLELVAEIYLHTCAFVFVSVAIVFRSDVAALANSEMAAWVSFFLFVHSPLGW